MYLQLFQVRRKLQRQRYVRQEALAIPAFSAARLLNCLPPFLCLPEYAASLYTDVASPEYDHDDCTQIKTFIATIEFDNKVKQAIMFTKCQSF